MGEGFSGFSPPDKERPSEENNLPDRDPIEVSGEESGERTSFVSKLIDLADQAVTTVGKEQEQAIFLISDVVRILREMEQHDEMLRRQREAEAEKAKQEAEKKRVAAKEANEAEIEAAEQERVRQLLAQRDELDPLRALAKKIEALDIQGEKNPQMFLLIQSLYDLVGDEDL